MLKVLIASKNRFKDNPFISHVFCMDGKITHGVLSCLQTAVCNLPLGVRFFSLNVQNFRCGAYSGRRSLKKSFICELYYICH